LFLLQGTIRLLALTDRQELEGRIPVSAKPVLPEGAGSI
jgi:hypothetical protein